MFKISQGLQTALLTAIGTALNGNMLMKIYSGAVPVNAHSDLGSAVLLRTVSVNSTGAGLNFEATPVGGMLVKSTSQVWAGPNVATGLASFYRIALSSDTGIASTTALRLQGSVGLLDADLILGSTSLVIGVTDPPIGIFAVGLPTE